MNGMQVATAITVAPDHIAAFLAPLLLPLVIWLFFATVNQLASWGMPLAIRFVECYRASSPLVRIAAVLMLLAGLGHLVLVPGHLAPDPTLALLFALDGLAFAVLAVCAFISRRWRPLAAILVVATLGEYLRYLVSGREQLDEVGVACYLLELVILALVWIPEYRRVDRDRTMGAW